MTLLEAPVMVVVRKLGYAGGARIGGATVEPELEERCSGEAPAGGAAGGAGDGGGAQIGIRRRSQNGRISAAVMALEGVGRCAAQARQDCPGVALGGDGARDEAVA